MMKMKVRRFLLHQKPQCHHLFLQHQTRSLCGKTTIPKVNRAAEGQLHFLLCNHKSICFQATSSGGVFFNGCGFVFPASKPLPPAPAPDEYLVSPITGEKIPASKMQEHMRIGLLDPRWLEQRDRSIREKQSDDEVYAPGQLERLTKPVKPTSQISAMNFLACVLTPPSCH